MDTPLAFLLTFRTYGTWLHGDERGSVDDDHNIFGSPFLAADIDRQRRAERTMKAQPMIFDDIMRRFIEASITEHCRYRGWNLLECAVRTNHIHIVVEYGGVDPDLMIAKIKSRVTRCLRERRMVGVDQPVWADRPGSRKYLWKPDQVEAAMKYVRYGQNEPLEKAAHRSEPRTEVRGRGAGESPCAADSVGDTGVVARRPLTPVRGSDMGGHRQDG